MENNRNLIITAAVVGIIILIVIMVVIFRGDDPDETVTEPQTTETVTDEETTDANAVTVTDQDTQPVTVTDADTGADSTDAGQTGVLPADWNELTEVEKILRNPLGCDLETQIMYAEDGSCHDIAPAEDTDGTEETEGSEESTDEEDMSGEEDGDDQSTEEESQEPDTTSMPEEEDEQTPEEMTGTGISGVTVTEHSKYDRGIEGSDKWIVFDVTVENPRLNVEHVLAYHFGSSIRRTACENLSEDFYKQFGTNLVRNSSGRYAVTDVPQNVNEICIHVRVNNPYGPQTFSGIYSVKFDTN